VADGEQLPFPGDAFDLIYSWGVIHHSPDTPTAVLEGAETRGPRSGDDLPSPLTGGLHALAALRTARGSAGARP
jgi:hypothetical protein